MFLHTGTWVLRIAAAALYVSLALLCVVMPGGPFEPALTAAQADVLYEEVKTNPQDELPPIFYRRLMDSTRRRSAAATVLTFVALTAAVCLSVGILHGAPHPASPLTMPPDRILSRHPDVMNGALVFAGTRVPVEILVQHLAAGDGIDKFLDHFPTVSREQAVGYLRLTLRELEAAA